MKNADFKQKTHQQNVSVIDQSASAGPNGIAVMPLAYGMDMVDRELGEALLEPENEYRTPLKLKTKSLLLQRVAIDPSPVSEVPSIVHEVLRSPGQPLDDQRRALLKPRKS